MFDTSEQLRTYSDATLHELLQNTLQTTFKLNGFRQGQREALTTLLRDNRLLCIQPTGHGKSLLYQLPSVLLPGITIVLSPLLALMRDQIQQLNQRFGITAASINSDQSDEENNQIQNNANNGELKILFVAPEKLDNIHYVNFLLGLPVSLVVVDEAHCISTWGHDFRPSYRQILYFIQKMEETNQTIRVLAITATANPQTEQDIIQQLTYAERKIAVQRQSLSRPNLQLDVINVQSISEKLLIIKQLLEQLSGNGLIYCATRENTEMVANYLKVNHYRAAAYHAGFHPDIKQQLQREFINNEYQVIVATNALGMGIDKSDLRYIIHFDVVGSITAYYQEVGRAGRDGLPARGILLFDEKDKKIQQHFIDSAQPRLSDFEAITHAINNSQEHLTISSIKCATGLHPTRVTVVLAELIEQEYLYKRLENKSQVYLTTNKTDPIDCSRFQRQLENRQRDLSQMLQYGVLQNQCLMGVLRSALGDADVTPCGQCCGCKQTELSVVRDNHEIMSIDGWLTHQAVSIDLGKLAGCETGSALFDSKLRLPLFVEFMKNRQLEYADMNPKLLALLKTHIAELQRERSCTAIIAVPSSTWVHRELFATILAEELNIPLYLDVLNWRKERACRQGECMNNDQRKQNVSRYMKAMFREPKPTGTILLFDDYIGSGATLKEAARALKIDTGIKQPIVPFTIANVRWRLGQKGMI